MSSPQWCYSTFGRTSRQVLHCVYPVADKLYLEAQRWDLLEIHTYAFNLYRQSSVLASDLFLKICIRLFCTSFFSTIIPFRRLTIFIFQCLKIVNPPSLLLQKSQQPLHLLGMELVALHVTFTRSITIIRFTHFNFVLSKKRPLVVLKLLF